MNVVIENALKLSTADQLELYHQLQKSLGLADNQLSEEQMEELVAREAAIAKGEMKMISSKEFSDFLKERRNGLHLK